MTPWIPQPDPLPLPGPPWLFTALLLLTFFLHLIAMNLVVGGTLIALTAAVRARTSEMARTLAVSISALLPVGIAGAVTLGVAALLFLQVLYGRVFFASSVLMAVWWLAVVPLLITGYYAAYGAAHNADRPISRVRNRLAVVAVAFVAIAVIYTTNMTLMLRPAEFIVLFQRSARGLHGNAGDPTFVPRLAHTLLSALAVTGLAIALTGLTVRRTDPARGGWMIRHGARWFTGSTVCNLAVGVAWLGMLPVGTVYALLGGQLVPTLVLAGGSVAGLAALFLMLGTAFGDARPARIPLAAGCLALAIALMTLTRDFVRHAALSAAGFIPVTWSAPQWGPIAIFFVLLAGSVGLVAWMVWQLTHSRPAVRPEETKAA